MNKKTARIIMNLVLVIVFLVALLTLVTGAFVAAWLHTYEVFTQKTLAAEITVSEQKTVNGEKTFDVTYKPVKAQSALLSIFSMPSAAQQLEYDTPQTYTLKGDEVRLGGQVIKFTDPLNLLGFKTIYKITRLEGDYLDASEQNAKGTTAVELNGGNDSIFVFAQNHESGLKFLIETAMGDYTGKNVQSSTETYKLYVTEEAFLLEKE